MAIRANYRWLGVSLLLVLVVAAAGAGLFWWRTQPGYLIESAQGYYAQGEAAQRRHDSQAARQSYQFADRQLQILLDNDKAPNRARGLLLRHKVLLQLAALSAEEAKAQQSQAGEEEAGRLAGEARLAAFQAARADPGVFEAQAVAQNYCFRDDDLRGAVPFAENLLEHHPEEHSDFPDLANYLYGAHYVLALNALRYTPPRPDVALDHLQASADLQRREARGVAQPPRWRALGLEVQALKAQIEQARQARFRPRGPARPDPGVNKASVEDLVEKYHALIDSGLERLRAEKGRKTQATATEPERPEPASLSVSNTRGLFDFLLLAIPEGADRAQVLERTRLFLEVAALVAEHNPSRDVLSETVRQTSRLTDTLANVPESRRPRPADLAVVTKDLDSVIGQSLAANVTVDPLTYLRVAGYCRSSGRYEEALRLYQKGLEVAEKEKKSASDPTVLELHAMTAWMLLLLNRPDQVERHLASVRQSRQFKVTANLILGLGAVLEGRLEQAIPDLLQARKSERIAGSFFASLGLAQAFEGTGEYTQALRELDRLTGAFRDADKLSAEERTLAGQLLPNLDALQLEQMRCYLALGEFEKALAFKKQLQDKPNGVLADLLLIDAALRLGRERRREGRVEDASAVFAGARKLVDDALRQHPDHAGVVYAEVNLILEEAPDAPAVGLALGGAARVGRLMAWFRAEQRLHEFAFARTDLQARLLWVRWLEATGRFDEADAALKRVEQADLPEKGKVVELERAHLALARGRLEEAAKLAGDLEGGRDLDLARDFLQVAGLAGTGRVGEAEKVVAAALGRNEEKGHLYLWKGQLAQSRGDFVEAAWAFDRALPYSRFRARAEAGLVASLLALARKETPSVARETAEKLRKAHPADPGVLLACAEMAVMVNELKGRDGAEGALAALKTSLGQQDPNGPYLAARVWVAADRPDLALYELDQGLSLHPGHLPSLVLAGQTALGLEDWGRCLKLADALEAVAPDRVEPLEWRGAALVGQGQKSEARRVYRSLVEKAPHMRAGYLGLARLAERDRDLLEALRWTRAWREADPGDVAALQWQVRFLTRAGRADEADRAAEGYERAQRLRLEKAWVAEEQVPKATQRDSGRAESLAGAEMMAALAAANGFLEAGDYDRGLAWADRAMVPALKLPESGRKQAVQGVQLFQAEAYAQRALKARDPAARNADLDKAIALYQALYQADPRHFRAGNNLAWLLHRERGADQAALAIVEELRKGRFGPCPVTGDRLPLEFLDTAGAVYRANRRFEEAQALFREALGRYDQEPLLYVDLARCQAGLGQVKDAFANYSHAIRLAGAGLEQGDDTEHKARLEGLISEARREQSQLRSLKP